MKKMLLTAVALIASALLNCAFPAPASAAQEVIAGDWTAKVKETSQETVLWISLTRDSKSRKGWGQFSHDVPLHEFSGLNPNASGNVQFTLAREAGAFVFDGLFKDGKGAGDYRFTPSGDFVNTMRGLGYEGLTTERLFELASLDVNTGYIKELKALGYDNLPVNKLIELKALGVTPDYIRKLRAAGLKNVSLNQLIEMKATGIDKILVQETN